MACLRSACFIAASPNYGARPFAVHGKTRQPHLLSAEGLESRSSTAGVILGAAIGLVLGTNWSRPAARSKRSLLAASAEGAVTKEPQEIRPYGSWESPITASFVTAAGVGLGGLKCDDDATLYWVEARPEEGGRQVVCRYAPGDALASERGGVDMIPESHNARTRVHEYGGASHMLGPDGDGVIYSNFIDQRLYWSRSDGSNVALTSPEDPRFTVENSGNPRFRFADAVLDEKRNRLICVVENHSNVGASTVINGICSIPLDGSCRIVPLIQGKDFFAAPRLSPDGNKLAYICWNHPSMPWDETALVVAHFSEDGQVTMEEGVIGGKGEGISVMQPAWSPTGLLHFVADSSGWWNLYRCASWLDDDPGQPKCRFSKDAEFAGAAPGWLLGGQNYCFLKDGRVVTCYKDNATGASRLVLLSEDDHADEFGQDVLPATVGDMCPSSDGQVLYFLGGSVDAPNGIYKWILPKAGEKAEPAKMIVCSMREDMRVDVAYISVPKPIEFPTASGEIAHGYHYSPTNPRFVAPEGTAPPLLVRVHGGPTACAGATLSLGMQYWTSRGFAVLDVDYRGSTGYGRAYRDRLKGNWGITDVEDVCAGAEHLVKQGLVDPKRLAIDGGSAGGFTTLAALAFRDVFTAGCSLYGVPDLAALASDTHKFESRYLDGLVGKYPEDKAIYDARAPIRHVEQLSCPILLLQGAEDRIVPKSQAETMYQAVKAKGLPCALKIYEQEQHGFRRSENIQDALNSELSFFASVFGFEASGDDIPVLEIANFNPKS